MLWQLDPRGYLVVFFLSVYLVSFKPLRQRVLPLDFSLLLQCLLSHAILNCGFLVECNAFAALHVSDFSQTS